MIAGHNLNVLTHRFRLKKKQLRYLDWADTSLKEVNEVSKNLSSGMSFNDSIAFLIERKKEKE